MRYSIFILLVINFHCFISKQKPLPFENLYEIYTLKERDREAKLIKEGFELISKNLNGETYVRKQDSCKFEGISFLRFANAMEYYLRGTVYRNNYNSIKKEVGTKGFLYMTTKRDDDNLFTEIYSDKINYKVELSFSIIPHDSTARCDDEQFRIRFLNRNSIN